MKSATAMGNNQVPVFATVSYDDPCEMCIDYSYIQIVPQPWVLLSRADLIITALGIVWSISFAYYTEENMLYKWGVAFIILRFITVSGKRVRKLMLMYSIRFRVT